MPRRLPTKTIWLVEEYDEDGHLARGGLTAHAAFPSDRAAKRYVEDCLLPATKEGGGAGWEEHLFGRRYGWILLSESPLESRFVIREIDLAPGCERAYAIR